ncbi:hypothetical protein Hgul01_02902 [Herpetosiphon gulosus]|uniref:Transposase n=1 Tax=Herpetosiphon gulosus TaxID=1973496 RepID=A0ABP9X0X8_9CHLR
MLTDDSIIRLVCLVKDRFTAVKKFSLAFDGYTLACDI